MLLYNHKKEFIGIDQNYLEMFNLSSLVELKNIVDDFADFFVSSPGYVHNFEHAHWIDYVLCNDAGVTPKVLININEEKYTAHVDVKIFFLTNEALEKSYIINLSNIKALSSNLEEQETCQITKSSFDPLTINYDEKTVENIQEIQIAEDIDIQDNYEDVEIKIKLSDDEDEINQDNNINETYEYDPKIASNELGLPIDLVQEFIQDFISQSYSFKTELYNSVSSFDLHKAKLLTHKLKGVAANLRIQDALNLLTKINLSDDVTELSNDLDNFYVIITNLSNNSPDEILINFKETSKLL